MIGREGRSQRGKTEKISTKWKPSHSALFLLPRDFFTSQRRRRAHNPCRSAVFLSPSVFFTSQRRWPIRSARAQNPRRSARFLSPREFFTSQRRRPSRSTLAHNPRTVPFSSLARLHPLRSQREGSDFTRFLIYQGNCSSP